MFSYSNDFHVVYRDRELKRISWSEFSYLQENCQLKLFGQVTSRPMTVSKGHLTEVQPQVASMKTSLPTSPQKEKVRLLAEWNLSAFLSVSYADISTLVCLIIVPSK